MLLRLLFLFISLNTIFSCSTHNNFSSSNLISAKKEMKGKITSETFVNKGGKEISTTKDLYFVTGSEKYFIKFMESNISYQEAIDLLDQEIKIIGDIKDGLWDVPADNPQYAQSRSGRYLSIDKIIL